MTEKDQNTSMSLVGSEVCNAGSLKARDHGTSGTVALKRVEMGG